MGSVIPEGTPAEIIGGYDVDAMEREDAAFEALRAGPDGRIVWRALLTSGRGVLPWRLNGRFGDRIRQSGLIMSRRRWSTCISLDDCARCEAGANVG